MTLYPEIPSGYMQDGKGRLVSIENVKEIDKLRDDLVKNIIIDAKKASAELAVFKSKAFRDIEAFIELSAEQYGVKMGGVKGNVSLTSYDGKHKIQRSVADHISFDERLSIAKQIIDECIHEWSKDSDGKIKALIEHAFQTDKEGKVSTTRILGLKKINIDDEKWDKAMDAIFDSINICNTKTYIRLYERIEGTEQFRPIPLDVAAL